MQGKIISVFPGLILGDDGNRYAFTTDEWQDEDEAPAYGMRIDLRGTGLRRGGHLPDTGRRSHAARRARSFPGGARVRASDRIGHASSSARAGGGEEIGGGDGHTRDQARDQECRAQGGCPD